MIQVPALPYLAPVRIGVFIIAWWSVVAVQAQQGLVINEVQAANRTTLTGQGGSTPDWIELYNPDRKPRSLKGMRIRLSDRVHHFEQDLWVPARGHLLLLADGRLSEGPEHLGFRLDRDGGSLLLVDRDGTSILDVFTFGALSTDRSMGRLPDGGSAWSIFHLPSPAQPNRMPVKGPLKGTAPRPVSDRPPGHYPTAPRVQLSAAEGCRLHLTLDATDPRTAPATTDTVFNAVHGTVLRAICRCPGLVESEEHAGTYTIGPTDAAPIAIIAAPKDLWGEERGILVEGLHDNHTRGGTDWERSAMVQLAHGTPMPAGLRVSGSGSRGLAKRSLKLYARDRYGSADSGWVMADGTRCDELMLRADASPHAFLSNLLMEDLVDRAHLELTQQPSQPRMVLVNGKPWGLYRAMPPKDAQWLRQRAGAEAVDVLEGASFNALSGNDDHFRRALDLLERQAPLDSLQIYWEVESLVDLACIDMYTGRADHELNVRCYRPRQAGGRWRWVLFDLDLWTLPDEPTVPRMLSGDVHAAPFLPLLLRHPQLEPLVSARLSSLLATTFHPAVAGVALDSLYLQYRPALEADHDRWRSELNNPAPLESRDRLNTHLRERPMPLLEQMARATGRRLEEFQIDVPSTLEGEVRLNGLPLPEGRHRITWLSGVPATVELIPRPGHVVDQPRGGERMVLSDPGRAGKLRPRFRYAGL